MNPTSDPAQSNSFLTPRRLFFFVSAGGILGFTVLAGFWGRGALDWLVMEENALWQFTDHFRHIRGVVDPSTVYETNQGADGCYPPLAYVLYRYMWLLTAVDMQTLSAYGAFSVLPHAMWILMVFTLLSALCVHSGLGSITGHGWRMPTTLAVLLSPPALAGAIERGNSTLLVVGILLWAVALKDGKSRWQRESALLLFALAAGLRLHPAVAGFLYLKEKRWPEALRLAFYGALFILVPFFWFGGVGGFLQWVGNIVDTSSYMYPGSFQFISGFAEGVTEFLWGEPHPLAGPIATTLFVALMLTGVWFSHSHVRQWTFLAACMAFVPSNAYRYTLLYFAIPFALWLRDTRDSRKGWAEAVFFGALFTLPVWWALPAWRGLLFSFSQMTHLEIYLYGVAYAFLLYQIVIEIFWGNHLKLVMKKSKIGRAHV